MATFTATANSNSTIGYAQYGSTTWNRGTTNGACQGAYQGTSASRSRVGVMVFSGAGAALKGKIITQITLRITCSAAGSGSSSKKLSFRRCQLPDAADRHSPAPRRSARRSARSPVNSTTIQSRTP